MYDEATSKHIDTLIKKAIPVIRKNIELKDISFFN